MTGVQTCALPICFGTIILPGLLLLVHSPFVFGYAKPVPVNFGRLDNPKRDMVWVALAGPVTNIALAIAAGFLFHLTPYFPRAFAGWFADTLERALIINVVLAVFNMLPIPPLDGGRVLTGLLPRPLAYRFARVERYGMLVLIGLLFLAPIVGTQLGIDLNLLNWVLGPPVDFVFNAIVAITGNG